MGPLLKTVTFVGIKGMVSRVVMRGTPRPGHGRALVLTLQLGILLKTLFIENAEVDTQNLVLLTVCFIRTSSWLFRLFLRRPPAARPI